MKFVPFITLFAAAIGVATPASARTFGGGGDGMALFEKADTNRDGRVTRAEFDAARAARFQEMDRNGDGVVSREDFKRLARFRPEAMKRIDQFIAQGDTNGDARLTLAELRNAPARIFDRLDTDGDGAVDQAERDRGRELIRSMREQGE